MVREQVALRGVSKVFPNGVEAVSGVDLAVEDGEFFTVVGPSGSGKSTLLRLIAGLEEPTAGSIRVGGRDVTGLPPRERDVAMAFQAPALYPHLSVFENLAFGLRARRVGRAAVRERVLAVATSLGLETLLRRRPQTLSGGQRQRVALGRAVARRPAVCLFDEPLSSLDGPLRAAVRDKLTALHRRTGATFLYVTHDQAEALALSDRLAVMDRGRIVQAGAPREVYERPASRFVGAFLGDPPMRVLPCQVDPSQGSDLRVILEGVADVPPVPIRTLTGKQSGLVELGLRPEHVAVAEPAAARDPGLTWLPGTFQVVSGVFQGHGSVVTVALGPHALDARLPARAEVRPGASVAVGLDLGRASWFDPESGKALGL
jgi:ABC-type sugar transport system ATPase subunit